MGGPGGPRDIGKIGGYAGGGKVKYEIKEPPLFGGVKEFVLCRDPEAVSAGPAEC